MFQVSRNGDKVVIGCETSGHFSGSGFLGSRPQEGESRANDLLKKFPRAWGRRTRRGRSLVQVCSLVKSQLQPDPAGEPSSVSEAQSEPGPEAKSWPSIPLPHSVIGQGPTDQDELWEGTHPVCHFE